MVCGDELTKQLGYTVVDTFDFSVQRRFFS